MYRSGKSAAKGVGILGAVLAVCLGLPALAWSADASPCPSSPGERSADQVLADHVAAVLAMNAALVACDYSDETVVILPGQIAQGPDQVEALYAGFFKLMGGNISVQATGKTSAAVYTQLLYTINSDHVSVSDGVDTFVIRHGQIVAQTIKLGGLTFK